MTGNNESHLISISKTTYTYKVPCTAVMQLQTAYVLSADVCFCLFFPHSYLKYLAWALSDRDTVVRLQAIKALTAMYSHRWVRLELHLCVHVLVCACAFVWVVELSGTAQGLVAVFVPVSVSVTQGVRGQAFRLHLPQALVPNHPLTRCCWCAACCVYCLLAAVPPLCQQ